MIFKQNQIPTYMRISLLIVLFIFSISISAVEFIPSSTIMHLVIGKPANDPLVIYYVYNSGFNYEQFQGKRFVYKYYEDFKVEIYLALDEGLNGIEFLCKNPQMTEKYFGDLMAFYHLPFDYYEFLMQDNKIWGLQDTATEDNPQGGKVVYYPKGSRWDSLIKIFYSYRNSGDFIVDQVIIRGDFTTLPPNIWQKDAEEFLNNMTESERQAILELTEKKKVATPQINEALCGVTRVVPKNNVVEKPHPDIWGPFFSDNKTANILKLFNKKDYSYNDWKVLQEKYNFSKDGEFVKSPKGKIVLQTTDYSTKIRSMLVKIESESELQMFGLEKQMSYNEIEEKFGPNYIRQTTNYTCIAMPTGVTDKKHHIQVNIHYNADSYTIMNLSFEPLHPEDVQIGEGLAIIPAGAVYRGFVKYQWVDGYWFGGIMINDLPYSGSIYSYESSTALFTMKNGKMLNYGVLPSILMNTEDPYDPLYVHLGKAIDQLNEFEVDKNFAFNHLEYIRENGSENYQANWKNLDYYTQKCFTELALAHEHLFQVSLIIEKIGGCEYIAQKCRDMMTAITGLKSIITTFRNVGSRSGQGTQEDVAVLEKYDSYIEALHQAKNGITQGLKDCEYKKKVNK